MKQKKYKTLFIILFFLLVEGYSLAEEIPKNQCFTFANQFLKEKNWGEIGKPNKDLLVSASHNIKSYGAPIIKFVSIKKSISTSGKKILVPGAAVETSMSSSSDDRDASDQWTLKFTDLEMKDLKNRIVKGDYTQTYLFETSGTICKLRSIEIQFKKDNSDREQVLDKDRCSKLIGDKATKGEQHFQNVQELKKICKNALSYFDNDVDTSAGQHKTPEVRQSR